MKLAIDIPAEAYKAISEWDEPKTKYAAEYMLYQFVKNGKRIELKNCSDAISRQDAIDAVQKNTFRLTFSEEQNCEGHVAWSANAIYSDVIEGALLELPPVRVAEKTGRWIDQGYKEEWWAEYYNCSECGYGMVGVDNYCPNCGAKMEVEE